MTLFGLSLALEFLRGLLFFVQGLLILFVAPRISRLEEARWMSLLALFSLCESALVWDQILAPALVFPFLIPPFLRTLLLGLGYGSLLAFAGFLFFRSRGEPITLARMTPVLGIFLLWLTIFLVTAHTLPPILAARVGETVARLGMGLPGGWLACWGLFRSPLSAGSPRRLPLTQPSSRLMGGALAALGTIIGIGGVLRAFLSPIPVWIYPALSGLALLAGLALSAGLTWTFAVVQQEVERWAAEVLEAQALAADRERISRELHDGIIQSIYAAGLMLEGVQALIPEDPAAAQAQLSRVMVALNHTIQEIRRYIFNLRGGLPEADLIEGLETLLQEFRINTLLETRLTIQGEVRDIPSAERRQHVFQIVREALANVARHAHARKVEVRLTFGPTAFQVQVADDGVGFAIGPVPTGQGLRNIRERARLLDGTLDIESAPGQGVTLTLTVPYQKGEL
ncbi:MAG: sensor histidine kinase [Anaerolineae bacterium]|nr:sensor histidine kinase [Anaerolineae bacterium]MDW7991997.1 sensor histidine kinase [Anaerolineae bacterium]